LPYFRICGENWTQKGCQHPTNTMQTSRHLQLYSIIFLYLSTFAAAWPWPRWLPELDSLIVRENNGSESHPNRTLSQPINQELTIPKTRPPQQRQRNRVITQNKLLVLPQPGPTLMVVQPQRSLLLPPAAIMQMKRPQQYHILPPSTHVFQQVECQW
jgi:hypothetical protein